MRAVLSASEANATIAPATKLQSYESVKSQCRKSVLPAVIKEYREKCSLEMLQPLTQGQNLTIVGQDRTHTTHSHTDAHWYTLSKTIRIVWWGIFRAKLSGGEISATDGWTFFFPTTAHGSFSQRSLFPQPQRSLAYTDHWESCHHINCPWDILPCSVRTNTGATHI